MRMAELDNIAVADVHLGYRAIRRSRSTLWT